MELFYLVIGLVIFASFLMCFIVLIQESKGGGLASGFAAQNNIMGVRKTTDILEKATWGLAIAMVVLSVISTAFVPKATQDEAPIQVTNPVSPATDASNVPSFPATGNAE